ncbi:hypothetical protein Daus18300_007900 [Diaporthe australafricana]|uniref:Uncharacterized protein n=1 Tax=Diaporthe australafricana TaxID=127596 RepID=A0ABR3WKY9_9PEZI
MAQRSSGDLSSIEASIDDRNHRNTSTNYKMEVHDVFESEADNESDIWEAGWLDASLDDQEPGKAQDDGELGHVSECFQQAMSISEDLMIGSLEDIKSLINQSPKEVNPDNLAQLTQMVRTIQARRLVEYFEGNLSAFVQREGGVRSAVTIEGVLDWWENLFFLPPDDEVERGYDTLVHTSSVAPGGHKQNHPSNSSRDANWGNNGISSDSLFTYGGFDGRPNI